MGRVNTTSNDDLGLKQVSSATGFSAGDLIYETGSGIGKIPTGTGGNGTFSATGDLKLSGPSAGSKHGFARNLNIHASGVGNGEYVCKLASGKIAVLYYRYYQTNSRNAAAESQFVYIRIYNEDGTINVAETAVTEDSGFYWTGNNTYPALAICQLSGGNIAVAWGCASGNSNTKVAYAIHNGTTGAQITAPVVINSVVDGSNPYMKSCLRIEPLTGGNCVIAWTSDANTNMYHTIINSTGGSVMSARSVGQTYSGAANRDSLSLCAREDGNYCVMQSYSGGYYFWIFNSTGTQVAASGHGSLNGGALYGSWMTRDSNNQINIYMANSGYVYRMTVASGATNLQNLESIFANSNLASFGGGAGNIGTGGYAMVRAHCIEGTTKNVIYLNIRQHLDRLIYVNSDGTEAAPTQVIGGVVANGYVRGGSFVETSGEVRFYTNSGVVDSQYKPECPPTGIFYYGINKSALNVGGGSGVTGSLGSATAATAAYSESGSTVKNGAFLAAADGSASVTNTRTTGATLVKAEELILSGTCDGYDVDGRQGGGFFLCTYEDSTVKVLVYDSSYTRIKTVTVVTNANTSAGYSGALICQLGNGKVVVAYGANGTNGYGTSGGVFKIYNSSMDTVLLDETAFGVNLRMQHQYPCQMQGLMNEDGDEFAFAWSHGDHSYYGRIGVWNDAGTQVGSSQTLGTAVLSSYSARDIILCALPNGDVGYAYNTSGYNAIYVGVMRRAVDGSNWFRAEHYSWSTNSYPGGRKRAWKSFSGPTGSMQYSVSNSSGANYLLQSTAVDTEYKFCENSSYYYNQSWGIWGIAGSMTSFKIEPTSGNTTMWIMSPKINDSANHSINQYSSVRPTGISSSFWNSQTIPLNGHEAGFFFTSNDSANSNLGFFVVRVIDEVTNIGYTTSTACDPIALDDPTKRARFLGVAVTDCPAGGSGSIQTKGNGKIGTSYKDASTAENFNFESHSADGKAGSQVGRSVIIRE